MITIYSMDDSVIQFPYQDLTPWMEFELRRFHDRSDQIISLSSLLILINRESTAFRVFKARYSAGKDLHTMVFSIKVLPVWIQNYVSETPVFWDFGAPDTLPMEFKQEGAIVVHAAAAQLKRRN